MRLERLSSSLAIVLFSSTAWAQGPTTTRVSVNSGGGQGSGSSGAASISADGRYVAFRSTSGDLVANDANTVPDIFRHDLQTGLTERASVDSAGVEANHYCESPSISADGRFVAFCSYADNLVANDSNSVPDVFRHDFLTGATERASVDSAGVEADSVCYTPSISADGRYVAFTSYAGNLVANDANLVLDVFRHDFQTGVTERASVDSGGGEGNGDCYMPSISADGRYVAFMSFAVNLVANDTNSAADVFRHDFQTGVTERASVDSSGVQANSFCYSPSISADGRHVAFHTDADNLVVDDTNFVDVFRHDFQTGATERASVDSAGVESDKSCYSASISADGRYVAFHTDAGNLVANDTNSVNDVFRHDFQTGFTERMSVDSGGVEANGGCHSPSISGNGRRLAFTSSASNLVWSDSNGQEDVFVHDSGTFVISPTCFGDGTESPCPCKPGAPGRGCENSGSTGGALLAGIGEAFLSGDTLQLVASDERPTSLSLFWQGSQASASLVGDGLGCVGGPLKRMYYRSAVGGTVMAPLGPDPSVSARSAALGDPISPGTTRVYQTFYRDGDPNYCPYPFGSTFNATNALLVLWKP